MEGREKNREREGLRERRLAWLLTGIVLALFLASAAALLLRQYRPSGEQMVEIYQNGICIRSLPLRTDATFTVQGEGGAWNVIRIKDGSVCVLEASCPHQLCVQMGSIRTASWPITCLPNRLVIRIRQEGAADAVVY